MRARRHIPPGGIYKVVKSKIIARTPCGKQGYTNRKTAAHHAAVARRETGEAIYPYKCPNGCHCWHIGHSFWRPHD